MGYAAPVRLISRDATVGPPGPRSSGGRLGAPFNLVGRRPSFSRFSRCSREDHKRAVDVVRLARHLMGALPRALPHSAFHECRESYMFDFVGTAAPARTGDPQIHNLVDNLSSSVLWCFLNSVRSCNQWFKSPLISWRLPEMGCSVTTWAATRRNSRSAGHGETHEAGS